MKSHWSGLAPNPGTGVLIKVGNLHTGRWVCEEEEEITVTCLQANDGQGLPSSTRGWEGQEASLPGALGGQGPAAP